MYILDDFQQDAVDNIRAKFLEGNKRVLLQSATGSGKTVIGGSFISKYMQENPESKVMVLVNLQVLVGQTYDTLNDICDVEPQVLHDELTKSPSGKVYTCDHNGRLLITMVETFLNTVMGSNKLTWPNSWVPDLILIDEAHKATSVMYQSIKERFPDALILGMTATPYRAKNEEGEHLQDWYGDNLVTTISVSELIKRKRLVKPIYRSYNENTKLVDLWLATTKNHSNKRTIIFTSITSQSVATKAAFLSRGINAEIITAVGDEESGLPKQTALQRQRIYDKFESGEIQVLISVMALCEGFDSRAAHFCFLAKKVGNHALYQQMIGRVLRTHESKKNGFVIDLFNNIMTHGTIEDYQWSIQEKIEVIHTSIGSRLTELAFTKNQKIYVTCKCSHVFDIKRNSACIYCGEKHNCTVQRTVGGILEKYGITDAKHLLEMRVLYRRALRDASIHDLVNMAFRIDVFKDGAPNPKYKLIQKIAEMESVSMSTKLVTRI